MVEPVQMHSLVYAQLIASTKLNFISSGL